nr:S8 family serine peptidase [Sphingobium sp.]
MLSAAAPSAAQLGIPNVGSVVGQARERVGRLAPIDTVAAPLRSVTDMARDRLSRVQGFLRANRAVAEPDDRGEPARKGVILMLGGDAQAADKLRALGFASRRAETFGNLDLSAVELMVPDGMRLSDALPLLRQQVPDATFTADQLHFPAGNAAKPPPAAQGRGAADIRTAVGVIDGGVGPAVPTKASRGFATGAPTASNHGTAIASLLRHAGVQSIISADVYGRDPAGGSALAIVRALDWMQGQRVPVVSISLTGPGNPLLARAVAACVAKGMVITAAVGNDGPGAPPVFPASYPSVLAVTGVDGRNRVLIEAGRATHLDYAAPGADMKAMDARGRWVSVRGTSYAAPLVAARAAAMKDSGRPLSALDGEARDLGAKGADPAYGRGLLCGDCRPR